MNTKHFLFSGAIILILLAIGYFIFAEWKPSDKDLINEEPETVVEVDEVEETPVYIDDQSYCADLLSRKVGQEESYIILESIPNNKISDGQRISGCVYNVAGSYGGWAPFEAQVGSFHLRDGKNDAIASGPLSVAGGDWMTRAMNSESLQFNGVINFDQKNTGIGILLLRNENASGETELDKTITLPITF